MADNKKTSGVWETSDVLAGLLIGLVLLSAVVSGLGGNDNSTDDGSSRTAEIVDGEQNNHGQSDSVWSWKNLFSGWSSSMFGGSGIQNNSKFSINMKVSAKNALRVWSEPAGTVLGEQSRLALGIIKQGPVQAFNANWWFVEFENVPSGWVDELDLNSNLFSSWADGIWKKWTVFSLYASIILLILWIIFRLLLMSYSIIWRWMFGESVVELGFIKLYDDAPVSQRQKITESDLKSELTGEEFLVAANREGQDERWTQIQYWMRSYNENDWRQAIIAADVMLDDMLTEMGYEGTSVGERLMNVDESDFHSLDQAWEAHKVRNRLAHDGAEYRLSYEEAERVIAFYKTVFSEFYWV